MFIYHDNNYYIFNNSSIKLITSLKSGYLYNCLNVIKNMVNWKKLEDEVDNAINKGCHIKFDSKTKEECKYQQKYAEDKRLIYERVFNIVIFGAAIGIPIFTIGLLENKFVEYFFGIIIVIFVLVMKKYILGNKFRVCSEIILDAEKRILLENSGETKMEQETSNISLQTKNKCNLSIENWINILNSEIDNQEIPDFIKIVNPILVLLIALIGFMVSSVNTKLSPIFLLIWSPISYVSGIAILVLFVNWVIEYRKIDTELKNLKRIREDVISGNLRDSNEIYGEWNEIHRH